MKKLSLILFSTLCILAASAPASAVTREEMEQARATAAKWYLRYANNMSDYLDDINPKSVNELEGKLKDKEKENIIKFNSIATPTDYASWDKEKLVSYWGGEFFKNNKDRLGEKGADCYNKVKEQVSKMTVSAPGTPEPAQAAPADAAAAQASPANAAPVALGDTAVVDAGVEDTATDAKESGKKSNTWTYIILIGILIIVVIWLVAYASKSMKEKNDNSRQRSPRRRYTDDDDASPARTVRIEERREERRAPSAQIKKETIGDSRVNDNRLRRMERELIDKEAEIRRLEADLKMAKGDLRHAEAQLDETTRMLEEARAEIRRLRTATTAKADEEAAARPARRSFHKNPTEAEVYGPADVVPEIPAKPATEPIARPAAVKTEPVVSDHENYMPKPTKTASAEPEAPATIKITPVRQTEDEKTPGPDENGHIYMPRTSTPASERTIFLGRVNAKGIFVRADRSFNPGNSYYRLVTSDGTTGKFAVINDPSVWEQALVAPDDILFNACIGPRLNETHGRNEIITEESGTAAFENGAWRVTEKAKIRYL